MFAHLSFPTIFHRMSDRAKILRLARSLVRQNASRAKPELDLAREINDLNLQTIPPALWDELDALLDHNPPLGVALGVASHARHVLCHNPCRLV